MNSFCGSKYWDLDKSWNTTNPDFTLCFQETALIWAPCALFWCLATIEISIVKSIRPALPWTLINISKLVLSLLLVILSAFDLITSLQNLSTVYPVSYYTSFIRLFTFIISTSLMYYERRKGIHTSAALFILWLLLSLTSAINYRSLLTIVNSNGEMDGLITETTYITRMASSPIIWCLFFFSCFADIVVFKKNKEKVECPINRASFLSKLTFWWVNPLISLGHKKPLTLADMWTPMQTILTAFNTKVFDKYYYKTITKTKRIPMRGSNYDIIKSINEIGRSSGVLIPLLKTYWAYALMLFLFRLSTSLMTFINPTLLDWMISFVSDSSQPLWRGVLYAMIMFFSSMVQSLITSQNSYFANLLRIKQRACMTNTIYKKSLLLSTDGRKDFTIGEIVNLFTMDTHRIVEFVPMVNSMWAMPLQISIAIYLLWQQLGIATLAGVSIMLFLMPLNGLVMAKMRKIQSTLMKLKDKRIKLMNEILSGIRVWKMYGWEQSFNEKVMQLRNSEISQLITRAFLHGFIIFSFNSAQVLVSVISFAVFVIIDDKNILDANVAFVSLSLFGILGGPLTMIPRLATQLINFLVSLRRVNKYLNCNEIDFESIEHNPQIDDPIVLEDASFVWSSNDVIPVLNNISLKVKKNKLIAVVGQVGSGKSSLISALLGDMIKTEGMVNVNGKIAYVPQQAWIMNSTLKENVLFMKPMDRKRFDKVLDSCALRPDLEILPGGEMTEIGEKGINLSGGQKQRVSMARACYADADIYLLDDPISALDANVSKHVFDRVIGSNGLLRNKTRILVTHRISVLPKVDEIVVMKDGSITEFGTYRQLLEQKGEFADFLIQYLENQTEDIDDEDIELYEEIVSKIKPELERTLSFTKSNASDEGLRRRTMSALSKTSKTSTESLKRIEKPKEKERGERGGKKGRLIGEEKSETGSVKMTVYIDYLKKIGIWSLIAVLFSDIALSALNFGSSLWLSEWSDDSLDPIKRSDDSLRNLRLGVYGALGGGQTLFTLVATISITLACLKGAKILHNEMLVHLMRAPISHFDTTPMGRILNRFSKDIDTADTVLGMSIRMVMMRFFSAGVSFAIIGYETPYVILAVIPLGIVYYFIQRYYISTSRQLRRIQSNARSPVIGHFSETLSGASSIRAYGISQIFIDESNLRVDTHHSTTYESNVSNQWLSTRLEFLGYSIVLIDALFIIFTRKSVSPGMAGLTLSYAMKITGSLNALVNASTTLETDIVSVERCVEYTQTPTEAEWFIEETKPEQNWPQKGLIKFENYSTRYREGLDLVLKQIDFIIRPGQRVGVVGRTGAGKSSLTLALFRLIEPSSGTVRIDSVDISKLGLYELRSKLTIIPQDPVLFSGTLRVNLDPFDKHSDQEVWTALELAHLKSFVSSLALKLNHEISEGGSNLSVGQKQLVCLARALLRRSRILVLDEATAAVDVETDDLIQNTIRKEFKDCTIVTIAHRLNTILDYDMILVMDNGMVREYDSPKVLLEDPDSMFYSMAKDAGLV